MTEEEYIPATDNQEQLERAVARFMADKEISSHNKELAQRYLRDAALGKTIIGRAKKKIGPARRHSYVIHLTTLIRFVRKDLDKVTQEDMEQFIEALEADEIRSRGTLRRGPTAVKSNAPLSARYKVDIKVSIKKFYKWLWGRSRAYPELVEWIDTYDEVKEIPALTEAEVEKMIDRCTTTLQRALIEVLFDGGFRLGELLNIRLKHTRMMSFDQTDPSKQCLAVRVPFSKTLRRTVVLPMHATTKWLTLWLEDHPAKPRIQADGTIDACDTAMQLFPMSANAVRVIIRRAGTRGLGKRVYPHLLRHSSATYWSNKLSWFKMCKRFGWSMTSSMPQRYIDREGVDELEVATIYQNSAQSRATSPGQVDQDAEHSGGHRPRRT